MKRWTGLMLLACCTVTMLSGCGDSVEAQKKEIQKHAEALQDMDVSDLVAANNKFAFDIFAKVRSNKPSENLILSPFSISSVIGMLRNGAAGETEKEISKMLGWEKFSTESSNEQNLVLMNKLINANPDMTLHLANSLWADNEIPIKEPFLKTLQTFYAAEAISLDLQAPKAVGRINDWVNENTKGKIPSILEDPLPKDVILILLNAVYFHGDWDKQFEKNRTKDEPFTLASGQTQKVPMMHQSGRYNYLETKEFQALELPYKGKSYSLLILLPDKKLSLEQFLHQMNSEKWMDWKNQFGSRPGDIALPRFKFEEEMPLNTVLQELGMQQAFQKRIANLSGITDTKLLPYVSRVFQKAMIDLAEEGTTAAAVTGGIVAQITSVQKPVERFKFVADHPFFFAIRHNPTGTLLFMGSVYSPNEKAG